ncbi:MAG: hypothetical protein R2822_17370 [Spirosomataceae bacterium]
MLTINRATTLEENKGALDNSGTIRIGNIATLDRYSARWDI